MSLYGGLNLVTRVIYENDPSGLGRDHPQARDRHSHTLSEPRVTVSEGPGQRRSSDHDASLVAVGPIDEVVTAASPRWPPLG